MDEDYSAALCDQCGSSGVRARWVAALPSGGVICLCGHHHQAGVDKLTLLGALTYQLTAV